MSPGTVSEMRGARNYARLIDLLLTTGGSVEEIVEVTGFHEATVYRYIKALRELRNSANSVKKLRIIGWSADQRGYLTRPVYKLEPGYDARRPRVTDGQKSKAYRQRKAKAAAPMITSVFDLSPSHSVGHSE